MSLSEKILSAFTDIVGQNGILADHADMAPYLHEERGLMVSRCDAVIRPASSEETSAAVKICVENSIPIVPVGGNTGLVGGGVADGGVVIATNRMNKIIEIDDLNHTMIVEAGVILAEIQNAAVDHKCLFPLTLGAEGSCRIGGNIATNAGGSNVLRYGNTRDLILGLEVVLPSGDIWNGLNALRKDNTG
ncbi:MAG: hydroxyacid dehydrogenase, partial [Rhodospirillaceae bacterium]|nr:hydroxyacid dehydrogenase [Rhodospirillaceae bacterium]